MIYSNQNKLHIAIWHCVRFTIALPRDYITVEQNQKILLFVFTKGQG